MGWDRHKLLWDGNGTDKYAHGQPCEYTSGLTSTPIRLKYFAVANAENL